MGTALTHVISTKGYEVTVISRDELKVLSINNQDENPYVKGFSGIKFPFRKVNAYTYNEFSEIVKDSGIIILTVPSLALPETLIKIKENIPRDQKVTIVLTSKGADIETGKTPYKLACEIFRTYKAAVVIASVVGFAEGIANKEMTAIMVSSDIQKTNHIRLIKALLQTRYTIIENSFNPNSACLSGLLKNVGSIMIGMCEGTKGYTFSDGQTIKIGENSRWAFINEWSKEMLEIAKQLNIEKSIIEGLVGKVDLGLSSSPSGRNWTFGYRIAVGENIDDVISNIGTVEGIGAARYLDKVTDSKYVRTLVQVLDKEISPKQAVGIVLSDNNALNEESKDSFILRIINSMGTF